KRAKDLKRHLSKEDIQMANKHMKMSFTTRRFRSMQIKATMIYHFISLRVAIIRKATEKKCWQGCRETGALVHRW
ncbi:LORF2 protein, partial [Crocuta crocuta]